MGVYLPALTRRPLYIATESPRDDPGVSISNKILLRGVRGYASRLIDRRQSVHDVLFHSQDPREVARSLDEMLALQRPIVVIVDARVHPALPAILAEPGRGEPTYRGRGLEAWSFRPAASEN